MFENISIFIVSSSHASVDGILSTIKSKILSKQRPYIACLSYDDFRDEMKNENFEKFFRQFINEKLDQSRIILDKLKERNEFNQLEFWKRDTKRTANKIRKDRKTMKLKNQSCMLRRDELREIVLDFPVENKIELYLILFDVNDCNAIKSIAEIIQSENDECSITIINFYPRYLKQGQEDFKNETFWLKLVGLKFEDPLFDKIAFIDFDVPEFSPNMLKIRSQLIYDQFSHFLYDFELDIKSGHREFLKCLNIHEVILDVTNSKELKQLEKQLNEIPLCMLTIEKIYEALLETIAPLNDVHLMNEQLRQSFEIAAFGKTFRDMTDKWQRGCYENFKIYSNEVLKLESLLHDIFWRSAETVSIERRQILNYFMEKIAKYLRASGNEEVLQHLEFYIYVLEFTRWHHQHTENKNFYETRSVGHAKKPFHVHLRASSDIHIDYKNHSRIPIEIEHLTNDVMELRGVIEGGNFYVQLYSKPSMLQRLKNLIEQDENFQRQHFTLFDVMLLKFQPLERRKIFSTKSYKKVLPTPLCFRDFNDYGEFFRRPSMDSLVNDICHDDGDKRISSQYKPEDFILQTSIKRKLQQKSAESDGKLNEEKEQRDEMIDLQPPQYLIDVFDSSNKFTKFTVNESFFNSINLQLKVQLYHWLNYEEHLNLTCALNSTHLSFSNDLSANKFKNATLHDELSGMICSIDMNNARKIVATFTHGMRISTVDGKSIEFDWMRLSEREESSPVVGDEKKRIYFSNGFVMVNMRGDTTKVYSPSGTIYEITQLKSTSKSKSSSPNQQLTKLHQFSITSIHFLAKLVNISSYTMTIFSGNRYHVENDSIVEELKPTWTVRELCSDKVDGNLFYARDDGLKLLHTSVRSKCLYPDGTLIVTSFDHHLESFIAPPEVTEKPIPILDEIWLSDAVNLSKIAVDDVLESIKRDYFLCIKGTHQFEHKLYGRIQFGDENFSNEICKMELHNGARFTLKSICESILISLKNGTELQLSKAELQFSDEKCSKCCSSNKLSINIADKENLCGVDKILAYASDIDGNSLEVQQSTDSRQAMFYKAWKYKAECRECSNMKEEFNIRHFSERWLILNRDMTGYEIFPQKPASMDVWIETNDTLLHRSSDAYEILIDDKDLNIDIERETTSSNISMTQIESNSKRKSQQSLDGVKEMRKKMKNGSARKRRKSTKQEEETFVIEKLSPSPWITLDPSITTDISLEHRELIEFYVNPLSGMAETLDVGLMFKLQRDNFTNVTDALCHLKKYINEKFIINTSILTMSPLNKKSFDENFGFIVRKSIEGYVEEKLEQFRYAMARAIIEDLLVNAFKSLEKEAAAAETKTKVSHVNVNETRGETVVASSAIPIATKSFSFV